jgi:RNA polymerase sigma factor (sigma-70 family)
MTDVITIERMTEEQNASIRDIVNQYGNRLFGFIRNRVNDLEDAQDILQDVYYEFTETSKLSEPIDQASSWLFRVARNKIIDKYRKKKTDRLDDIKLNSRSEEETFFLSDLIAADHSNTDDRFDNSILMLAIEEALDELPKEQREVFVMHELEDKSFKEISEITGITLNTLLSRKRYAIVHLRKRLSSLYNEMFN